MFGGNGYNDNYCRVCRGEKKLEVVVLESSGRVHERKPRIICDACNGSGRIKTAAEYAQQHPIRQC